MIIENLERWLRNPFHELDKKEMSSVISYGTELLKRLHEEFEAYPRIQEIIRQKQGEVDKQLGIYHHVVILKDEAFRERHWETLFEHMRESEKGSLAIQLGKIDLKKLTLNDLLEYHLLSHSNMLKQILAVRSPQPESTRRGRH